MIISVDLYRLNQYKRNQKQIIDLKNGQSIIHLFLLKFLQIFAWFAKSFFTLIPVFCTALSNQFRPQVIYLRSRRVVLRSKRSLLWAGIDWKSVELFVKFGRVNDLLVANKVQLEFKRAWCWVGE
ncbi:Hypothetical_protein [Hexamita inflata]|uniref:Hypothetical_protein n=1 Tax=Hexamita inflata TaxID=28002 RepID=A0AA86NK04_9EUKA|nr:Hypothetical protein HINF_LOCUS8291 [Hexamita inflata]